MAARVYVRISNSFRARSLFDFRLPQLYRSAVVNASSFSAADRDSLSALWSFSCVATVDQTSATPNTTLQLLLAALLTLSNVNRCSVVPGAPPEHSG